MTRYDPQTELRRAVSRTNMTPPRPVFTLILLIVAWASLLAVLWAIARSILHLSSAVLLLAETFLRIAGLSASSTPFY